MSLKDKAKARIRTRYEVERQRAAWQIRENYAAMYHWLINDAEEDIHDWQFDQDRCEATDGTLTLQYYNRRGALRLKVRLQCPKCGKTGWSDEIVASVPEVGRVLDHFESGWLTFEHACELPKPSRGVSTWRRLLGRGDED